MLHLLLSFLLVTSSLFISVRRNGVGTGYLTLSWIPAALWLIGFSGEKAIGFQRSSEVMYHFSFDTSYLFALAGGLLVLHALRRQQVDKRLALGLLLSALPIIALIVSSR